MQVVDLTAAMCVLMLRQGLGLLWVSGAPPGLGYNCLAFVVCKVLPCRKQFSLLLTEHGEDAVPEELQFLLEIPAVRTGFSIIK